MRFTYAVPAGLLAASILFTGCASNNNDSNTSNNNSTNATNSTAATNTAAATTADFTSAVDQYRTYVIEQCDEFVKQTENFTNAVKEAKIEEAKALYAPARMYYERIEPIAEALGDLDPNIDARENDVEAAEWRGFHKLEKALWQDNTTKDMTEFADQ